VNGVPRAGAAAGIVCAASRIGRAGAGSFPAMSIKYYAHFLVDEPDPRGMQEYRGVVELDGLPRIGREFKEAVRIIARNFGRPAQDVKVLQWARLH
jgi:hypothetical protein